MENVEWKDIPNYENLYQISNNGVVRRLQSYDSRGHLRNPRTRKTRITKKGYPQVGLYKNGIETKFLIHKLVAETFIPNPDNLPCINHKDENPLNNCVSNLEWCTYKYNANYGSCQIRRVKTRRERRNGNYYA